MNRRRAGGRGLLLPFLEEDRGQDLKFGRQFFRERFTDFPLAGQNIADRSL